MRTDHIDERVGATDGMGQPTRGKQTGDVGDRGLQRRSRHREHQYVRTVMPHLINR